MNVLLRVHLCILTYIFIRKLAAVVGEFYLDGFFYVVSVFLFVWDRTILAGILFLERPCAMMCYLFVGQMNL